ncbi:MAG: choice-of-anchor Q domain-containing protein, partial [Victivallaceae bacterium]
MRVTFFVFFLLGFFLSFQTFALNAPVHLEPVQSTFKKITIKWQNGDPGSQVTYQVYRNNSEIASVADTQYTDSSLETGTQYTYQVVAVSGGVTSSPSAALTVKTIKSATFDNSTSVEQVVDSLHPASASNFTGITLLSAVKSGLEALLGAGITFTAVDSDTLTSFIEEELAIIREVEPSMTDAERIAAQADLDATLSSGFGGNTFEHVYIQGKLSELAETHYQKGFKTGAAALYEFSLNYLSDQEPVVFGTLARLATFKIDTLTDTSTQVEIAAALADYKTTFLRLFDYFPNSVSIQAQSSYSLPAHKYFSYFPVLLNYGSYDSASFNNALQLAQSALLLNNDAIRQKFYDHIAAWELVPETIEFKDSSGNPLNGSITVRNITANTSSKDVFPGDPYEEERTVQVVSGQANFPVYKGHIYTAVVHFNVSGGNPLNYSIDSFTHEKGKNVTYNNLTTPVTENMASGTNYAKSSFVFDQPNYPYNLTYERAIDVFTLHWQWVSPSGFTLKNFKVFCGSSVVATVTGTTASNIPILPDADTHFYTVVAYDVNDNPSASSQTIFVVRDSAGYAGYFAWMQQYFGSQAMYSCDDPDGDQIDNFHEYLNGTDPTRIPGPAMLDPGQIGYSKAVLNWNPMFAGEAGVTYKLYRNDTEITPAISGTAYTDTGLTPGLTYTYRVRAVRSNGIDTEQGAPMAVRTVLPVTFNGSDKVQQVVDNLIPANAAQYTGSSLISAVKSGIEALSGSTVTFSTVSNDILNNFVTQELAIINEVTPSMTDAERLAAKTDLATMLNDNFGGNSFEHVYIQGKLTELGDEYYLKGDKEMGTALYELSLNYLKNMEPSVFSSLSRLATFKTDALTDTSTNEQIVTALDAYRDTYLRFFTFFPDSTSMQAQSAYVMPVYRYFKYFPALLKYDSYNQNVFNSAKQLSEAALAMNNSSISTARHARITAWELINLKVKLVATGDQPLSGTVTINNVSGSIPGNNVYPDTPVADSRTIPITSGEINVPVYKGHIYNVNSSLNISGYAMNVNSVLYQNGQSVKYTQGQTTPTTQSLPEGSNYAEVVFAYDVPPELIPSLDSDCDGIPDATELVLGYDPSIYTEIIYVDGVNGADANNGLSLAAAKRTINAAVTASKYSGKQHVIMVAAGTYTGTGNKNLDFGGYDIKLRSSAGSASTIIDLENSGRFAYFHTGESNQSWIDGFTIKNGNSDYGAGLRFDSAQAVVKNCVFSNNYAGGHGGAIYVNLRPLQVTNCKFSGNQAGTYAGALFLISSSGSELRNCEFTGNQAIASGGAECLFSSSQTVENCRFLGNQSSGNGGAVVTTSGSSLTLTNSLLLNNHASGSCSDLYLASSNDSLAMKNVTIAGGSSAYGFSCAFACPATLTNNIIQGNVSYIGATVANNNCSWNDFSANGSGNINFDPLLTVNGYLKTGSPCIDAGTSAGAPATDIDGVVRPAGSGVDIGCQEFKDTDGDGIPDNVEIAAGLDPYNPSDAALSKMNDGISNLDKYLNGMNPGSTDGDGDGITDAAELANGYDPSGYTELIYVDGVNGADANNGLSLAAAKRTINAAVTASKTAGKEHVIMVAAGTYTGSSNKNLDFGGYDIKLRSSAGAMATVIDLENSGRFAY